MEEKKSFSTQVLLSMNMDRLKEYMGKMGDGINSHPPSEDETAKRKRSSRFFKKESSRNAILVRPEPLTLSRIIAANDKRMVLQRYTLAWGDTFSAAYAKMCAKTYRSLVVFSGSEKMPSGDLRLSSVDFLMLVRGVAPANTPDFMAKKRDVVMTFVPGSTNEEKVASFRLMKEAYRNVPAFYVAAAGESAHRQLAGVGAVTVVTETDEEFTGLFRALEA